MLPFRHELSSKKRERHRPLRTFSEMADEFDVDPKSLRGYFADCRAGPPPRPRFQYGGGSGSVATRRSYYDPQEFRAWWKAEQEVRAASPGAGKAKDDG